jgi:UDP-glucose:(heptosyl)LPS alpha-1,3-glucosyltransferase
MQFADHLIGEGCRVTVLTTSVMPSRPDLTIVPIRASRSFRSARTLFFSRRAALYVRTHHFDVVHCITPCVAADVYQPRGGTIPETLARNTAIRATAAQRNLKRIGQSLNVKYRILASLESRLLYRRPAPYVIAISDYVSRQLQEHYDFDPARIVPVFNGVDPDSSTDEERRSDRAEIRRQYGVGSEELLALCIAHNFKLKGVAKLIEALARPAAQGFRALVVGRDNPVAYARLAERLGIADRVIFAGPTTRISAFFHAADVLVHPTYYDPCSRVVLEALSAGLPAITTKFNGAGERIADGVHGYVIESPEDVAALADRLGRLADAGLHRACVARARSAVSDCTMQNHARKVKALYDRIVKEKQA